MEFLNEIVTSFDGLLAKDYFTLFLIISLGIALGNLTIKGFKFDLSAVIFVAIFVGWALKEMGVTLHMPQVIETMGLLLFIFTIGIQAGPSFFDAFRSQGKKLILLISIIIVSGGLITFFAEYIFGINEVIGVGLFNGALTSTPGLAAAIEAASRSSVANPSDASIGYGIAYPFGVVGVVLFVKFAYKIFRVNLKTEEEKYISEVTGKSPELLGRNFLVTNENIEGKSLKELNFRFMTKANISRILHPDGEMTTPEPNVTLRMGDVIRAVGTREALERVRMLIGQETDREIPSSGQHEIKWYLVTKKDVVNKTIEELNLMENFKATVVRIRRSGVDVAPRPASLIRYGDKLLIASSKGNVKGITDLFGDSIKQLSATSFLPIALGIVLGIIVGSISIPLFGMNFSLGLTGGTLLTAILLSYKGKTGPVIWTLSGASNQLLRQLGLLLFLTPVGLKAGENLVATFTDDNGAVLILTGVTITLLPMIIATVIGYYMMKINFLTLLGALTGGMTSTPGLSSLDSMTETDAPHVAYAAVYPFALVWLIIISQILVSVSGYL